MTGARIIPFPAVHHVERGTVSVSGDSVDGFRVSHTSASEGSWGDFLGPFPTGQEAMTAAHALNRDAYDGLCNVIVCDAAVQDACPDVGLASVPGDF